jgi:hypothetical protein
LSGGAGHLYRRATALVLAGYAALAAIATSPLSGHIGNRVSYEGDSLLNTWILAHTAPTLVRAPARLFQAPGFVPYRDTLAFSEHLLFPSFLAWPVRALSGNPLLAHNMVVLLFLTLSGFFMFLLVTELTSVVAAGLAAGVLFATHTYIVNEVPRVQIQAQCFFPLGLLLLRRHFAAPTRARAAFCALAVAACGLSNNYYQLYMPLLFGLALPWLLSLCPPADRRRAVGQLAVALVPVLIVFAVLAARYLRVADRYGFGREVPVGIGLEKYLATRPENWIYGETVRGVRLQTQAAHFTGIVPVLLAAVGVVLGWRRRSSTQDRGLIVTALGGLLVFGLLSLGKDVSAFGRTLAPGPYRLLYLLPGFQLVRIPERFALLTMFWLAILTGFGLSAILARVGRAKVLVSAAAAALIFVEHLSVPIPTIPIPVAPEIPDVYRWLRTSSARKVVEVPFYGPWLNRLDSLSLYFAISSPYAVVNGYTGFYPPAYPLLRYELSSEPNPFFLETVERLGVDHVIVHPHLWKEKERPEWLRFLAGATDRLRPVTSFPDRPARGQPAWDHGGELVYEVLRPGSAPIATPRARTSIPAGEGWSVNASRGADPAFVLDGRPSTEWRTGDVSTTGDFLELRFDGDLDLSGLGLLIQHPFTTYPGALEVSIRRPDGRWRLMRFDRARADRELLAKLLVTGRDVWYDIDFDPVRASAIRMVVARGDPMLEEWRVPELRLYTQRPK